MVCVFARKTSEPLASLVKQIDEKIGENNQLKGFVVVVRHRAGQDARRTPQAGARQWHQERSVDDVRRTRRSARLRAVPDADITVLMWNHHKVKVNHAYKGELTEKDIGAIVADIPKILGD